MKSDWALVAIYGATCVGMYLAYKHYLDTREQINVDEIIETLEKIVSAEVEKALTNGNGASHAS